MVLELKSVFFRSTSIYTHFKLGTIHHKTYYKSIRYIYTSIKHYKTARYENDLKHHYLGTLADTEAAS